jgi:hypothetical protein
MYRGGLKTMTTKQITDVLKEKLEELNNDLADINLDYDAYNTEYDRGFDEGQIWLIRNLLEVIGGN